MTLVSKIYRSKEPYKWEAGKHSARKHKRAVQSTRKRRKKKGTSSMGWQM